MQAAEEVVAVAVAGCVPACYAVRACACRPLHASPVALQFRCDCSYSYEYVYATPAVNVSKTLAVPPCLGHKTLEPLQTVLTKAHAFFGSDLGGWPNHIPIVEAQTFQ